MSGFGPISPVGRFLMITGVTLFLAGLLLSVAGRVPLLGRLPGDIYVRRGNFVFYFPLTTGLILSLLLSLLIRFLRRR